MRRGIVELIRRKRAGGELTAEQIDGVVRGLLDGRVGPEQVAALLMAGVLRGFTDGEALGLTDAYVASGRTLDLHALPSPTIDKHSTGGVADTTTLVVVPLLAACDATVVKLAGRALGHTGGTIDKLEAIPGFETVLTPERILAQAAAVGAVISAASADLAPADRRIYALRDATGTVDDVALIAASVMSKKLAAGAQIIVVDVKVGGGGLLADPAAAQHLARICTGIAESRDRRIGVAASDMSQPLGPAVGSALEVRAAIDVLSGRAHGRLGELAEHLATLALVVAGAEWQRAAGRVRRALEDGSGLEKFREIIRAQGGPERLVDAPDEVLAPADVVKAWTVSRRATIASIDCRGVGELARRLAERPDGTIDPAAGLEIAISVGDAIEPGTELVRVHARIEDEAERALASLEELVVLAEAGVTVTAPPLIHRMEGAGEPL